MMTGYMCPSCFVGTLINGCCNHCSYDASAEKKNPMRLPYFTSLNGRYAVGEMKGSGGFGITYKAFDMAAQVPCAVKEFVPLGLANRETDKTTLLVTSSGREEEFEHGKKRFMEEAHVLEQLKDRPEVVKIIDFFFENNTAYFVMEYIDGVNLRQLMKTYGGAIPVGDAVTIICSVGECLEQVHRRANIFHRDISPDNIMITKDAGIKIIDFGNAKYLIGKNSQNLSVILKHGYAPPEQYSSTSIQGSFTDVYALAATFYHIVSGKMPVSAPDRFSGEDYIRLKDLVPSVNPQMSLVVDRALELNSKKRTQSAGQFAADLKAAYRSGKECRPYVSVCGETYGIWEFPQNKVVVIGRSHTRCDFVPSMHEQISKKHCELYYDSIEDSFYLIDRSTNGTYIAGNRIEKDQTYILKRGDQFSLGKNLCVLEVGVNE